MGAKAMYILPGGFIHIDHSILMTGVGIGQIIKAPVFSVLVLHDEGPILIDTGLNPDGRTDPENTWGPRAKLIKPEVTEEDDIRERLGQLGLKPSDVRMVILTHLHWDHTGGLRFFTHCPIAVQKVEYRFAYHPDSFVSAPYMRNHFDYPLNYHLLEGDQMILPGVSVITTPGHTPGHQSLLIRLDSGANHIISGDVISLRENLTAKIPGSNTWNARLSFEGICRLEHFSQLLGTSIFPSHDALEWEKFRRSPEAYR
jgi:N-acyl homoserine lactone hydrolase